jgi:hypothetical protein
VIAIALLYMAFKMERMKVGPDAEQAKLGTDSGWWDVVSAIHIFIQHHENYIKKLGHSKFDDFKK